MSDFTISPRQSVCTQTSQSNSMPQFAIKGSQCLPQEYWFVSWYHDGKRSHAAYILCTRICSSTSCQKYFHSSSAQIFSRKPIHNQVRFKETNIIYYSPKFSTANWVCFTHRRPLTSLILSLIYLSLSSRVTYPFWEWMFDSKIANGMDQNEQKCLQDLSARIFDRVQPLSFESH